MRFLKRAEREGRRYLNPVPTKVGGFSTIWKVLPQYFSNTEEKFPKRRLGPFRTDAAVFATAPASGMRVTWMGHSTMVAEIDGVRVLIDPVWDERASPMRWAGPKRFFAAPLGLEEMPAMDAVIVSHDHYDHLGEDTIRALAVSPAMAQARWITALGVGEILCKFGVAAEKITELDWTDSVVVTGASDAELTITAAPARHFSGRSLRNRFETLWSSFVLKGAEHNVYFGADSGWWEGFGEIGAEYGPFDVTMLEIGAFNELWKQIHMGPEGAAQAFAELGGAGLLMPIHWGLFDLALHGWREPMEKMVDLAEEQGVRLWSPQPGEPTEVVKGVGLRSDWWR